MPIDIKTSGYQKRERVAAPLDAYSATLNTLQQKHETAIDTANKIKTFLANKELNEAENKWLTDYSQQINNQIEAAAQEGSYATALTTATKLAGEVASNPALIGRERYQQQYKKFQDEINSSKEYDGDIKAYALAQNKYNYQDTTDENGRITGGTTFTPNYRPVTQVDIDEIYRKALSTVGVDASQGEQLVWGDDKGNIKQSGASIAEGDLPYLKTASGIKKLDAAKIRQAVEAAINQTPGARASLKQDYIVNAWKASRGDKNNLVTKKDGTIMSQEEFEESLLAPRYAASAYKHVSSSIDTSIGFSIMESRRKEAAAASAKAAKTASANPKELRVITDFYSPFGAREVQPDTPSKLTSALNDAQTSLGNMYAQYNIDKNLTDDQAYAELRARINQNVSITDNARNELLAQAENLRNIIQTNTNRLEAMKSHLTEQEVQAVDFLGKRFSNGNMASSDNPYQQKYAKAINKLFVESNGKVNDRVLVRNTPDNLSTIRTKLANLGFTSKDIRYQKVNGDEYIYISKDAYTKAAPEIADIIGNSQVGFSSSSQELPAKFESHAKIYNGWEGRDRKNSIASIYREVSNLSKQSTERLDSSFPSNFVQIQNFYIPQTVTVDGQTMTKNLLDDYSEAAIKNLSTADGGALKILMRDKSGKLVQVEDSEMRRNIVENIAASYTQDKNRVIPGWAVDSATGEYGMTVTLPYIPKTTKNSPRRADGEGPNYLDAGSYFIVGAPLNNAIKQFSEIPAVKAARTVYGIKYNSALQRGYKLSDSELGDGSYEAFYSTDENGNPRITVETGSGQITGNLQDMTDLLTNNYANKATLAPVKLEIEKLQARNGSIAASPVKDQDNVIAGIFHKVMVDAGVNSITEVPVEQRPALFQRFNSMYRNLTGENVSTDFQQQMIELLK